jgi:hypothetical protein
MVRVRRMRDAAGDGHVDEDLPERRVIVAGRCGVDPPDLQGDVVARQCAQRAGQHPAVVRLDAQRVRIGVDDEDLDAFHPVRGHPAGRQRAGRGVRLEAELVGDVADPPAHLVRGAGQPVHRPGRGGPGHARHAGHVGELGTLVLHGRNRS